MYMYALILLRPLLLWTQDQDRRRGDNGTAHCSTSTDTCTFEKRFRDRSIKNLYWVDSTWVVLGNRSNPHVCGGGRVGGGGGAANRSSNTHTYTVWSSSFSIAY